MSRVDVPVGAGSHPGVVESDRQVASMVPVSTGRPSAAVLLTVAAAVKANSNVVEVPGTSSKVSLSRHGEVAWSAPVTSRVVPSKLAELSPQSKGTDPRQVSPEQSSSMPCQGNEALGLNSQPTGSEVTVYWSV